MYMTDVEQLDIQSNGRYNGSCLYLPRDVRDCAISNTAKLFAAKIFTRTYYGNTRQTYKDFNEFFGYSRTTISRAIISLKGTFIERRQQSTYSFKRENLANKKGKLLYDSIPEVFFGSFDNKGQSIFLTPAEKIIAGHMFTVLNNRKKGQNSYTTSLSTLSEILSYSVSTISRALNRLKQLKILICYDFEKGVNKNQLSTYHLNYKVLNKYAMKKRQRRQAWTSDQIDQYYHERLEINEYKADREKQRALSDDQYSAAENKIRELAFKQGIAEAHGSDVYELDLQIKELKKLQAQRLEALGIDEKKFSPGYWCKCKTCNDTGQKPNGYKCSCYLKE